MKILLLDNTVVDIQENEFEVHESLVWIDSNLPVNYGDKYINGEFVSPNSLISDEDLAKDIRNTRDVLLSMSDWTQSNDVPQATKEKWTDYRQQLRDIPQQLGFPRDVIFPEKP